MRNLKFQGANAETLPRLPASAAKYIPLPIIQLKFHGTNSLPAAPARLTRFQLPISKCYNLKESSPIFMYSLSGDNLARAHKRLFVAINKEGA